jgi:hypothetical protein
MLVGLTGCGASAGREVPAAPTPLAVKTEPAMTFVSADGVHFVPGKAVNRSGVTLTRVAWRKVRYTRAGTLTLAGLGRPEIIDEPACPVDHVAIGPPEGNLRRVTVMAPLSDGTCEPGPRRIVLSVQGWNEHTIAAPDELDVPNPSLTVQQRLAGVHGTGVLQPDRRSITVQYRSGGCHDLARTQATVSRRKVLVRVFDGAAPVGDGEEVGCPGSAYTGHTLLRLRERVPLHTPIVVCDSDRSSCD